MAQSCLQDTNNEILDDGRKETAYEIKDMCWKDYNLALNAAKREMCRLHVWSIAGMEAHDFAVETLILSSRWGGRKYIARRAKLLVLEKFRDETGARLSSKFKPRMISSDHMNLFSQNKQESNNKDFDELLEFVNLPDKLKNILRCKVHREMKNKDIASLLGIRESSVSQYIGDWSEIVANIVDKRMEKCGINLTAKIKRRTPRKKQ